MSNKQISQHKRMAMGQDADHSSRSAKFAKGGSVGVPNLKTGIPDTPITDAKRANGVPGFRGGGKAKGKM